MVLLLVVDLLKVVLLYKTPETIVFLFLLILRVMVKERIEFEKLKALPLGCQRKQAKV